MYDWLLALIAAAGLAWLAIWVAYFVIGLTMFW